MKTLHLASHLTAELLKYQSPIQVIDIGAYPINGMPEIYTPLLPLAELQLLNVLAFDPQSEVCDFINQHWTPTVKAYPYAIADGQRRTLYHTANPLCSSLYPPNPDFMAVSATVAPFFEVIRQQELPTYTLNELPEIQGIDFLKLDVQGAELDILRHATQWLAHTMVIHCEVEFLPVYQNQPLAEDITLFLREHGFMLHRYETLYRKNYHPYDRPECGHAEQFFYADAVFVKQWQRLSAYPPLALLKMAIVLHACYHSTSLAALALQQYQAQVPESDIYTIYRQVTLPIAT